MSKSECNFIDVVKMRQLHQDASAFAKEFTKRYPDTGCVACKEMQAVIDDYMSKEDSTDTFEEYLLKYVNNTSEALDEKAEAMRYLALFLCNEFSIDTEKDGDTNEE